MTADSRHHTPGCLQALLDSQSPQEDGLTDIALATPIYHTISFTQATPWTSLQAASLKIAHGLAMLINMHNSTCHAANSFRLNTSDKVSFSGNVAMETFPPFP